MDSLVGEQSLFDEIPLKKNDVVFDLKKPEHSEPPLVEDSASAWNDFELIEDLIGSEAAWKIAEAFAGSAIYIPKSILTDKNYFDIRKKYKAGSNYRELAIEFGYTETHIRNIIHKK